MYFPRFNTTCQAGATEWGGQWGQLPLQISDEGCPAFWKRHASLANNMAFSDVARRGRPCWTVKGPAADLIGAPLIGSQVHWIKERPVRST